MMIVTPKPYRAIEFSGTVGELATTLGMGADDIAASIGALIRAGHLERISPGTYRFFPKPAR
jgi:hypothetical protein